MDNNKTIKRNFPYFNKVQAVNLPQKRQAVDGVNPGHERAEPRVYQQPDLQADEYDQVCACPIAR